jgi:hypothetical protein
MLSNKSSFNNPFSNLYQPKFVSFIVRIFTVFINLVNPVVFATVSDTVKRFPFVI